MPNIHYLIACFQKGKQRLKLFELGGYCNQKEDGLHDDPEDCENFIICFADRTFRTKCAYGTLWNHITKECDFPEKGTLVFSKFFFIY